MADARDSNEDRTSASSGAGATDRDRWIGLRESARQRLQTRDYGSGSAEARLQPAGEFAGRPPAIPGVVVFRRRIFTQPHRGVFGEFARRGEGELGRIGLWPQQWATARMVSPTAKGFHIHPPHIPEGEDPAAWFRKLFVDEPDRHDLRPYDREQWDVMFFVQGMAEMVLVDERAGMERKVMRFLISGDDQPGEHNVGVVIPAGVAHAIRTAGSADLIMVYGTTTVFDPEAEGRIAADLEKAPLPDDWEQYLAAGDPT